MPGSPRLLTLPTTPPDHFTVISMQTDTGCPVKANGSCSAAPEPQVHTTAMNKLHIRQLRVLRRRHAHNLESNAWFCANDPGTLSIPGNKDPNSLNLYDMHGSVFEWCWDYYDTYPTEMSFDYTGAATGTNRLIRGGGVDSLPWECRSAERRPYPPGDVSDERGFRLVRTIIPAHSIDPDAGLLYSVDSIVGNTRYVPGGTFTQGSRGRNLAGIQMRRSSITTLTRNLGGDGDGDHASDVGGSSG